VDRRRNQHITAVAAHIDARCDFAHRIAYFLRGLLEVNMPPARGDYFDACRQRAVFGFELA
jgi:hypothetical protein